MFKRNIATALLSFLGIDAMIRSALPAAGAMNRPPKGGTRTGRNSKIRLARKSAFNNDLEHAMKVNPWDKPHSHIKLARKAHMGEIGLPHGRRGLMVHADSNGRLKITA